METLTEEWQDQVKIYKNLKPERQKFLPQEVEKEPPTLAPTLIANAKHG